MRFNSTLRFKTRIWGNLFSRSARNLPRSWKCAVPETERVACLYGKSGIRFTSVVGPIGRNCGISTL